MVARLAALTQTTDPMDNPYLNTARAEVYRQRLETMGPADAASLPLRLNLGYELLVAGRTREAIEVLDEVTASLPSLVGTVPAEVLRQQSKNCRDFLIQAWLRIGEQANCIHHHGVDSCLFPIRDGGVHSEREGSERAFALLEDALADDPDDDAAKWLINLVAMTLGSYPDAVPEPWRLPPESLESEQDFPRFFNVAPSAGLAAAGLAGSVCIEDFDGDELLDVIVTSWGLEDQMHAYRNLGDGTFEDTTQAAGLAGLTGGLNMTMADYDNDGDIDVLVLRGGWFEVDGGHPNSLLQNQGDGTFQDVTESSGLMSFHPSQTASWGDYDGDGDLDLFVGNETGPSEVHPCELFVNRGDGTFVEAARAMNVKPPGAPMETLALEGYVKAVTWGDYDNDGRPDLFVSRIDGPNRLLRNAGPAKRSVGLGDAAPVTPWRFEDVSAAAGIGKPVRSFPAWFFDYDNDGQLDIFASGFRYESSGHVFRAFRGDEHQGIRPRLFRNTGDGAFANVTSESGLDGVFLTMGCNVGDLDGDGWPDMYLSTGEPDFRALYPNTMFRNVDGKRFANVTTAGGFGHLQKGHGIAFADLDNDGDQDVYAVMGGAYEGDRYPNALFRNPGHDNATLTLRLEGRRSNRNAIGARIAVVVERPSGATRTIHATVSSGASFGAQPFRQQVGLGDATRIVSLEIDWPTTGATQRFEDVPLDRAFRVVEDADELAPITLPRFSL